MAIDVNKFYEEFDKDELDPGKLPNKKIYGDILVIKQTMTFGSMPLCRNSNEFLSAAFQLVGTKNSICHYWERILTDKLKAKRIEVKVKLMADKIERTAKVMEDFIDNNDEVKSLSEKLSVASASRFFWSDLMSILHEVSSRVDSAAASLGVEAKIAGLNR